MQKDSIILTSSAIWENPEWRKYLVMAKLQSPDLRLGIVGLKGRHKNSIFESTPTGKIEDFVRNCMRRHFQITDQKMLIQDAEKLLSHDL